MIKLKHLLVIKLIILFFVFLLIQGDSLIYGMEENPNVDFEKAKKEYPYLIKAIKENPDKQLFDIQTDNMFQNRHGTHPTVKERILFLHENIDNEN